MSTKVKRVGNVEELTPQQEQVIARILAGETQKDAAAAVGVAPETVSRWKSDSPSFVAELNRRQRELWDEHQTEMLKMADEARQVLREQMQDGPNRLKAALAVLDRLHYPTGPVTPAAVELAMQADEPGELDILLASM